MPRPPIPPPVAEQARINLSDLRAHIVKRVGVEKAERYFGYLNRLLSNKLTKLEFNKLCLSTLGCDNLPLHNQLIGSVLKNAFQAKVPPPSRAAPKPGVSRFDSSQIPVAAPPQHGLPNGNSVPPSPQKSRSGFQMVNDLPGFVRQNGKADDVALWPLLPHDEEGFVRGNGGSALYDLKRPVQQHQLGGPVVQAAERPRTEKLSSFNLASVHSNDLVEVVMSADREEEKQDQDVLSSARAPLRAPLGIPFCTASVGGARRSLPLPASIEFASNYVDSELCHTEDITRRLEVIAQAQGLGGVTTDCANLLNHGLDAYLKRLIKSSVELVGVRSGHGTIKQHQVTNKQPHMKPINGVRLGNHIHMQSNAGPLEVKPEPRDHFTISLQDFKVAMELNPQQLGEDWPLLLEKISVTSFEE